MKRLLQFATVLFAVAALLTPLVEFFDSWDASGLSNDMELPIFATILALCLVLLVVRLVAMLAFVVTLVACGDGSASQSRARLASPSVRPLFVFPLRLPPLRI